MEPLEDRRLLATFVVNSTLNDPDSFSGDGICDTANDPTTDPPTPPSGICTFRAAIRQAANSVDDDRVEFNIPAAADVVPVIDTLQFFAGFSAGSVELDGTTQAAGKVELRREITISSPGGLVKGLVLSEGIRLLSSGNTVIGSYIGTNASGTEPSGLGKGITIFGSNNRIGGPTPAERNLISGPQTIINIDGDHNEIVGNYIGTEVTGESIDPDGVPNSGDELGNRGIVVTSGSDNVIGGATTAHGNVISGTVGGPTITVMGAGALQPLQTVIQNNMIGTNATGTRALGNAVVGIQIARSTDNAILDNVIAATRESNAFDKAGSGILLSGFASRTTIRGNKIGTNAAGTVVDPDGIPGTGDEFGHAAFGIVIDGTGNSATGNIIGGPTASDANVISGNTMGVQITNAADGNSLGGNYIGTNATGSTALPNGKGVEILFSSHNVIGGSLPNVISGNTEEGLVIAGSTSRDNLVAGNRIGTNLTGDARIPNRLGVLINDAPSNCIGAKLPVPEGASVICDVTTGTMTGNLIAGNDQFGIQIANSNAHDNRVQANRIGTDLTGLIADPDGIAGSGDELGNGWDGVAIVAGADRNQIGGNRPEQRNLISGNLGDGVLIIGAAGDPSSENTVSGNYIGVNATGSSALGNGARGIHIDQFSTQNTIGGDRPNERNIISGNGLDGVIIVFATAANNTITRNYIGTDKDGAVAIPNEENGLLLLDAQDNLIGKVVGTDGLGNLISGNKGAGVVIQGTDAQSNEVVNNLIGTKANGNEELPNHEDGLHILSGSLNVVGGRFLGNPVSPIFVGNVISGNGGNGITIEGMDASQNYVGANLIGTTRTGRKGLANMGHGIQILSSSNNRIGASLPDEPVLSGNTITRNFDGIRIEGAESQANLIGGNLIGTDFEGNLSDPPSLLGNFGSGVNIRHGSENVIGGLVFHGVGQSTQLPGNTIVANAVGVKIIGNTAVFNKIQRNSIFANRGIGIDLGADGSTPNDDKDLDEGPNRRQNFPLIEKLTIASNLRGTFNSRPNTEFTFDLYKTVAEEADGNVEGQFWVKELTVTTDANGDAAFDFPVTLDSGAKYFTLTTTDLAGNTSEFSAPLRQADLTVDPIVIRPDDIERRGSNFFLPFGITVRNSGTGVAPSASFRITGNGQNIPGAGGLVTMAPGASFTFDDEWDITSILQKSPRGLGTLELKLVADGNDLIDELDESNNQASDSISVDGRPVITLLHKEFADGVFLEDVVLGNTIDVFVDWNGELDGISIGNGDQPRVLVRLNGVQQLPVGGSPSLLESQATTFAFQMESDLDPGPNVIDVTAETRLHHFESETQKIRYDQTPSVPWIDKAIWTVGEKGGPFDKTAEYTATVFFPQTATKGFFGVPVDRVGLAGGAFGPEIPQAKLTAILRSDRSSVISGNYLLQGEVADENFGGVESAVSAEATGEFGYEDNRLTLKKLEAMLGGAVSVKSPRVPLPTPVSFVRAQGTLGLGVDATLTWEENDEGELVWNRDLVLGLEPSAEIALSIGAGPASLEVAGGASMRGEFSLAQNPCLLVGGNVRLFARIKAEFLVFEATTSFEWPVDLPPCGGAGESDSRAVIDRDIFTTVGLAPRFVLQQERSEGEDASNGLPTVVYPYAKPGLAQNADGTMTLVYVNEDPTKPIGQQLEMFASHYDGSAWSAPVQLTDDTLVDDSPSVSYDSNGNAVAVWSRLKNPISDPANTDPKTLLNDMEIVFAVRDSATETWSGTMALTANAEMDSVPQLRADEAGNVMVVWLYESDSDSPVFPTDDTTPLGADVRYATWDGANWSAIGTAVSGAKTNSAPQFALHGSEGLIVWSEDSDGDVTTDTDREIHTSIWDGTEWATPTVLAGSGDNVADLDPSITYDSLGQAMVGWIKSGVPLTGEGSQMSDQWFVSRFSNGVFSPPSMAIQTRAISEPKLIVDPADNLIAVWQGRSDNGPDIFYAVQDRTNGDWSEPLQYTDDADLEWWFNPFINADGELEILHLSRQIGSEPASNGGSGQGESEPGDMIPTFDSSRLDTVARRLGHDLTVDTMLFSNANPIRGTTVQVTATIRNSGDLSTPVVKAALLDDGISVGSRLDVPALRAGQAVQVTFDWPVPNDATKARTLAVQVDPSNQLSELDETNNVIERSVLLPDLLVEFVSTETTPDSLTVVANVVNRGGSSIDTPFDIALRLDDRHTGPEIQSSTLAQLAAGQSATVTFVIADPLTALSSVRTGFIVADSTHVVSESIESNNDDFVGLNPYLSWQNSVNPLDVDNDGLVIPLDALLGINELNRVGSHPLPVPAFPPSFFDVSGDGAITPLDVLHVINFLNARAGDGEGGGDSPAPSSLILPPIVDSRRLVPSVRTALFAHELDYDGSSETARSSIARKAMTPDTVDNSSLPLTGRAAHLSLFSQYDRDVFGDDASGDDPSGDGAIKSNEWEWDELIELLASNFQLFSMGILNPERYTL